MSILDEILEHKRGEVAAALAAESAESMARRAAEVDRPARGFRAALLAAPAPAVIAEIKRQSPSKGLIRADFDPVECAKAYAQIGRAHV